MDGLIQQNSLLISLLAGNLVQRPVRNGLHRQPRSWSPRGVQKINGSNADNAREYGADDRLQALAKPGGRRICARG